MRYVNNYATSNGPNICGMQQYGLPSWGASGPYQKVYEKFGITGSST